MNFYRLARQLQTLKALSSGNPKRIARRAKNVVVGRALRQVGFWRWLWR